MRRAVILGALFCVLALAGVEARATTAVQLTPEEQVAQSRAVVLGRCTKIETRDVDGRIFTYITFDVREVLKGDVTTGRLVIKQIGGEVSDRGEWIYGSPRYDVGRDSLVFLATDGEGALMTDGLFMGNYYVETGVDGSTWLRRDPGEGTPILKRPGSPADDPMAYVSLDRIRGLARAADKARTEFAIGAHQVPAEYDRPFEGESSVIPSYVLMNNTRWFEADANETVPFYCNPDNFDPQGGSTPDLGAAVQDALNAWSTVDGSSFKYQYMGVDEGGCGWGRPIDHTSRVSIDCHGEIAGEGCRSIIAIGGGHWSRSTSMTFAGQTFYPITEADVALQDGWCDYFQNPTSLREVITHELGHCLGLGHSADNTATMAPFIHNDGRGASLKQDDVDGLRFLYPGPTNGGGNGGGDGGGPTVPDPPAISTSLLADGTVGVGYAQALAVANGEGPFAWDLTSGDLPPGVGLTAAGALAGTPTVAGTYTFSVRVTDALNRVDAKFLSIKVHVPPPSVLAAAFRNTKHELTIVGANFSATAQFEINNLPVAPRKTPVYDASSGTFQIKGSRKQLHINKGVGTNQIVVVVDGERSTPYTF